MEPAQTAPMTAAGTRGHVQSQGLHSEALQCFDARQGEGPAPRTRPLGGGRPRLVTGVRSRHHTRTALHDLLLLRCSSKNPSSLSVITGKTDKSKLSGSQQDTRPVLVEGSRSGQKDRPESPGPARPEGTEKGDCMQHEVWEKLGNPN